MKKTVLYFVILLVQVFVWPLEAEAQTGRIGKATVEIGAKSLLGIQQGLKFKASFIISGMKGRECKVVATFLRKENGKEPYFIDCSAERLLIPSHDMHLYSAKEMFVPYSNFYKLKGLCGILSPVMYLEIDGKRTEPKVCGPDLFVMVKACPNCTDGKCRACHGVGYTTMMGYWGPQNMDCLICVDGKCETCKGTLNWFTCDIATPASPPSGGIAPGSGYMPRERSSRSGYDDGKITCPTCHGSGRCTICAGRGEKVYGGVTYDCEMCHGTGHCYGRCAGRGYFY